MKFRFEQLALAINALREPEALALLADLGVETWVHDNVEAEGKVHNHNAVNYAALSFNYTALEDMRELELLRYRDGPNWITPLDSNVQRTCVSHLGTHCTEEELAQWRQTLIYKHHLQIVQEVFTQNHVNPEIAGKRWYHYVIFGARHLIGTDLKFIVRMDQPGSLR